MQKCIYWHKKDFRLFDNEVLHFISQNSINNNLNNNLDFLPFYIWEDEFVDTYEMNKFHKYAISQCIESVSKHYAKYDIPFLEVAESMIIFLEKLKQAENFDTLITHMEHGTSATYARDKKVKAWCKINNVKFIEIAQLSVERAVKYKTTHINKWNNYMNRGVKQVPKNLSSKSFDIKKIQKAFSKEIKNLKTIYKDIETNKKDFQYIDNLQKLSEKTAILNLNDFLENRGVRYRGNISSPNTAFETGSRMSTYLAWGLISSRYITKATEGKIRELNKSKKENPDNIWHIKSLRSFTNRLHWREHFIQKVENNPSINWLSLGFGYRNIIIKDDDETMKKYLKAFLYGKTGEPLIDACMRCLQTTGFINFRMRAMCVSYAFYALHIDWRILGEEMAKLFYDYEPGIHWYQVQMQTGIIGIHTIRVYSPEKQLLDQDPELIFVRKWIPELSGISKEDIFKYRKEDINLGDYTKPIVDFKVRSKVMKDYIYGIKKVK